MGGQRAGGRRRLSELHRLPMPARAELVLEGDMYGDRTKLEGPFGEFMGYYASNASEQPIIKIRRVIIATIRSSHLPYRRGRHRTLRSRAAW